jgi:hypothetical protein
MVTPDEVDIVLSWLKGLVEWNQLIVGLVDRDLLLSSQPIFGVLVETQR